MFNIVSWNGTVRELDIDINNDNILSAYIDVVTGDEILTVITKDGKREIYDSANDRTRDYEDGGYTIKEGEKVNPCVQNEAWLNSTRSYDRLDMGVWEFD